MQPLDVLQRLAGATRARKEIIISDAYAEHCVDFFTAMNLAFDPFISFDIKRVAEILEDDGAAGTFSFTDFRQLCQQLADRRLTGDAAIQAIRRAAERCHAPTWNNVYRRVLLRNVEAIDPATINRVLSKLGLDANRLQIPVFAGQTAAKSGALSGQRFVDAKLSGTRIFAVIDATIRLHRETGDMVSHPSIEQALLPLQRPGKLVLDGVLVDGILTLFDVIPLQDFRIGLSSKTQRQRRGVLEGLQRAGAFSETRLIKVLPQISVDFNQPDGPTRFKEFCEHCAAMGHREVIVKKPEAAYVGKRTTAWVVKNINTALANCSLTRTESHGSA